MDDKKEHNVTVYWCGVFCSYKASSKTRLYYERKIDEMIMTSRMKPVSVSLHSLFLWDILVVGVVSTWRAISNKSDALKTQLKTHSLSIAISQVSSQFCSFARFFFARKKWWDAKWGYVVHIVHMYVPCRMYMWKSLRLLGPKRLYTFIQLLSLLQRDATSSFLFVILREKSKTI